MPVHRMRKGDLTLRTPAIEHSCATRNAPASLREAQFARTPCPSDYARSIHVTMPNTTKPQIPENQSVSRREMDPLFKALPTVAYNRRPESYAGTATLRNARSSPADRG